MVYTAQPNVDRGGGIWEDEWCMISVNIKAVIGFSKTMNIIILLDTWHKTNGVFSSRSHIPFVIYSYIPNPILYLRVSLDLHLFLFLFFILFSSPSNVHREI